MEKTGLWVEDPIFLEAADTNAGTMHRTVFVLFQRGFPNPAGTYIAQGNLVRRSPFRLAARMDSNRKPLPNDRAGSIPALSRN